MNQERWNEIKKEFEAGSDFDASDYIGERYALESDVEEIMRQRNDLFVFVDNILRDIYGVLECGEDVESLREYLEIELDGE